ncbi:E3 ubiquitin-protein ligase rnf213-alpha-like isoform X2 [Salarias fasciatus]|uniref:E3 ubiquitin-protein ligase rnf213-alpha-like isoform X2 n=1 Tax=Salarias fasciatus TaxID=181472 RepID=UPI0011765533|nr:E3 ubiquitin-protein ligase rnf213-alpha-like isoform X2 [Salarias fasciatus]XP_029944706.1 E3 ubiquitin-protein ligase rnf213-alpha-like isoform X2 [Salarias fasciatus]
MWCTACGHQILEKTPKFCGECGQRISVQPAVTKAGHQLKPLITDSESNTEKSGSQQDDQHVDNKESNRPNDESVSDIKEPDSTGSSVDPVAAEDTGPQQSGSEEEQTQTSDDDSEQEDSSPKTPPPPTKPPRPSHTAPSERLNIYFHAVLSKDFKFVPGVDRVFVNMVSSSGQWEEEAVELSVKRNLQEHGFLIEGCLKTTKSQVSKSIPYKYFVYRTKNCLYTYEYIYKPDSTQPTNRCLFVKEHLINDSGDWHQYDDIICAPPSKNVVKRAWDNLWSEQRKSLIQGKEIAGRIMLGTIFDILRDWTETNLRSFISQLYQFFQVYKDPYVYEERPKKWSSLNYGEENVTDLLKDFMLTVVIPQLSDRNRKSYFIQDDFKAALIMLHVRGQYRIKLYRSELQQLCAMLCLPKLEKDRFLQFWEDFSKEVSLIRSLPETLVNVINIVKKENMPEWIMALPLLHLLKGTTKPFERPPPGNPQIFLSWAGLQGIDIGPSRNMSSQDRRTLLKVMTNNSHLVEVDPLSVRSCLYFMSLDELRDCSSNFKAELLDILEVFTKDAPAEITANSHEAVSGLLSHIKENLDQERYSHFTEAYRRDCLSAAVRLLDKICKGVKPTTSTQNYPDIPVQCMHLVASVTDFVQCNKQPESREQDGVQQHVRELVISQAMSIMRDWMSRSFKQLLAKGLASLFQAKATEQFETWNNVISISFKDQGFTAEWKQTFKMDFEGKYKQESYQDQIDFYCNNIEVLKDSRPHVATTVEKCALEAVTHLCQTKSEGRILEEFKIDLNFGKLASAFIQKSWSLNSQGKYQEDEEVVLHHLLSWTAAKDIFQLHGADHKLAEQLSQDARDIITIAISSFIEITDQLVQGNLKISLLKIILERKDVFLALIKTDFLSDNESYKDNEKMKWLLKCRHDELESIYHEKELVDVLLTMSHKLEEHMTVDVADIKLKQQVNIECASLNDFMEVHRYDQRQPEMAGVVTYFSLDEEIREMAEVLHKFRDSYVFKKCWDQQAKLLAEDKVEDDPDEPQVADIMATLETIHEEIFTSCFDHFKDIYARLRDGTIRLEEVNQLFRDFKGKYKKLAQDLDIMCKVDNSNDKRWILSRMQQIEQYHELQLAVDSAEIIMMVKDTLCLQGDFRVLETLTEVNHADFQKEQLQRIDKDLMQAKMVLVDITEPRRLCLQELGYQGHFVKWVKNALEDINELKVFVDLTLISAGENDVDVDRVTCFHDAVLGYSSMLYELKPDSGFDAFIEVIKKLWRALENDNNLPKKLRDSARHLEWLKTVKDSHGSVERSSLSLASTINHKDGNSVVDTTALLRNCVPSAVNMLVDDVESGSRNAQRVEILLTLLSDNDEIKGKFLETVENRLHLLTQDGNTFSSVKSNWVLKEASNIDALQEGGTFRHTLSKHLQAAVSPLLAHLVSIIDRDRNMDLLLDGNSGETVKKLWLNIFADDKLLEMSHRTINQNSEARTILVQNSITQDRNMSCSMPFSWRIKDFLEELWVHALQNEGHTQQQFDEFFWKTPLGRYIAEADPDMQMEFFHRYLKDFICMTMTVSCQDDLQLLCNALNCCVNEMKVHQEEAVVSLPWVHAAYHKFKIRLQNLSRMICIEPQVTHDLRNLDRNKTELVHDVYAALSCVEHLETKIFYIDAQRLAWLRDVRRLQVPIDLVCAEDSVRHYGARSKMLASRIQAGWNRIYSLSLFVEHMLFGMEELDRKLAPLVLESTQRLGKILEENSDLKTQQSFEAVIDLLKNYNDEAVQRIGRFGLTQCPVCMGDPKDPLCLPCEHIFCVDCIKQWLGPDQMYCPLCMQQVNDDFPLVPTKVIRKSVNLHAQFRKQCNAFFIDLVSTVCFKDNSPPCSEVIFHLLSFLMTEASPVPILRANWHVLTKMLSTFDDSVDKNPVIRSVVLKLLLKYSFDEVKDYLQQHLMTVEQSNILEDTDKLELYCLYINCLEDSMFDRLQFRSAADQQEYLQEESHFLTEFLQSQSSEAATVEFFQQVTRVRMDLDLSASLFVEEMRAPGSKIESGTTAFMTSVVNLCRRSGNDWYRVYLIRKICSQHGVEFVLKLLKAEEMRWLCPEEILQKNEEAVPVDQYLVCGEDYKTIRDAVAKGFLEGKTDELDEACEGCGCPPQWKTIYLLLALYREVTTLYRDTNISFYPKPEQVDAMQTYIQTSKILASNEAKTFAQCLVTNQLGPLVLPPGASSADCVSVDLTVHLAAVLVCANQGILGPLLQLAKTPANMQQAFLPTMPEDMLAVAHQALGPLQWYQCHNGHPCTIGESGSPMEISTCLDCGVLIGGRNQAALRGFLRVNVQGDRTQTGHILGDPRRRQNPDMLDTKSISSVPFTIIRMITHMAMLLGAYSHLQSISAIIKPPVGDTGAFLLAHLREDMKHLIRSLGKGTDDTISVFHLLINSLLEPQQQQKWPVPYNDVLSTKEARNGWEVEISSIITSHLKHLDRQLKEVNAFVQADSCIAATSIMKLIFGDPRLFLASLPPNSVIHGSAVWTCREKVSLLSLTHIVEQNDGKDTLPVLWRFLHKEAEVRLVKHLPDILALQKNLCKKFQNFEVTFFSIEEFLRSHEAVSLKAWYKKHIRIFLTTWNQLRVSLETNGEIKIPAEFCQKDLDVKSDFRVLLPQRRGPGLCSTALVSYLIALHNDLIYCVDKNTGEETSYKVSPADLTDLHVIHYEMERDVMPLILANTQYSIERGQEYNLPKIQQQIISRFLQGKPFITLNGIPTLVNRHDRNYEIILKDVKTKIRQEPLQALTLVAVAGDLRSYSDVCEALRTLEVALGFLAMTGGEPHMQLSCYLEEVLQMGNQMAQHVLKALSVCCLKHCVALWQLLASLKSENMLQLKKDPFPDSEEYKKPLGEEERRLLAGFFSKNRADVFLLEMHEFLVLVLKNPKAPETVRPDWSVDEACGSKKKKLTWKCQKPAISQFNKLERHLGGLHGAQRHGCSSRSGRAFPRGDHPGALRGSLEVHCGLQERAWTSTMKIPLVILLLVD